MAAMLLFKMAANPTNFSTISLSQSSMLKSYRLDGYTHVSEVGESLGQLFERYRETIWVNPPPWDTLCVMLL